MKIPFDKYHGTGNDFIMIDNRDLHFPKENNDLIAKMCSRRFGVGADGLILVEQTDGYDFRMVYYNADGNESTMCGNGGRCIVAFAKQLNIIEDKASFLAIDGEHKGEINKEGIVSISMQNVEKIAQLAESTFELNTGSPHYVKFIEKLPEEFVVQASEIRNSPEYSKEGINVNFASQDNNAITMRTFERGVEGETYSCGTGAVAVALVHFSQSNKSHVQLKTLGGELKVKAQSNNSGFEHIELIGPANYVYTGTFISLS